MNAGDGVGTITIHQPEHLPWLGFFAKMEAADLLVLLDVVPFRKNYFQNRNRIAGHDGNAQWLTVPVRLDAHLEGEIRKIEIAADDRWRRKYLRTLEQRYARHPYFEPTYAAVIEAVEAGHERIADLNEALITTLARQLGIETPIVRASELGVSGTRSGLLASICARVGARVYLSGPSGREYLDLTPFQEAGTEVVFHHYEHPAYPQHGLGEFLSHLSVVDLLFNCAPDAREILGSGRRMSRR